MSNVIIEKSKIDILANAISAKSGELVTMTLDEMIEAVDGIETNPPPTLQTKSVTYTPSTSTVTGTVTADSGYDGLEEVDVTVSAVPMADAGPAAGIASFITESGVRKWKFEYGAYAEAAGWVDEGSIGTNSVYKYNAVPSNTTVTPTESSQTVGGAKYMMEGPVTVSGIPSNYVGSGVTRRSSSDLTASGATVTAPAGYYSSAATKTVASGTAGTPTATKGTVSNNSVSVTPSVTNSAGYISGGTKTGTAVTVSASELVSGTLNITSSGTKDVTNYASASVPSGTEGTPTATKGTVSNNSVSITPSVTNTSGFITGGTKTGTPVSVSASELVSGTLNITSSGTKDVTNYASASVAAGTEGTPTATKGTVANNSVTVTPSVTNTAGYISGGTHTGTAVTVTASELVSGSQTISQNGTVDVTNLEEVVVSVSGGGGGGMVTENIIPQQSLNCSISLGDGAYGAVISSYIEYPQDGNDYLVTFDGTQYICRCHYRTSSILVVGDYYITAGATYAEFPFAVLLNGGNLFYLAVQGSATHTLKVDKIISYSGGGGGSTLIEKTITANGTYNASDDSADGYSKVTVNVSGGSVNVGTVTTTNSSNQNTSISFTLPSGRTPKAFFCRLTSQIARSSNSRYYYVYDMRWDGSSTGGVEGNTFYMSSGTLTNVTSGYSYSQSNTTFTLSSTGSRSASPGSFYNGTYELVYVY